MAGYYSRYIKDYALIVEQLTRPLKGKNKKERILWSEEMSKAFVTLKTKFTEKPVLYAPNFQKELMVQTKASDKGIGVVFTESEKSFCTTERECAGIILAIKKLRHYTEGKVFSIETDHKIPYYC